MTWKCAHVSESIERPVHEVATFAGNPENLPLWAAGLSSGIRHTGVRWVADSPMGDVEVRFTGPIELGILDHDVLLPTGTSVHNPFRVLRNDVGSEVVFTVYQRDHMSDEEFDRDVAAVRTDLVRLRELLQASGTRN